MIPCLPPDWQDVLAPTFEKDYFPKLMDFVAHEYANETIYPPIENLYQAFYLTPYAETHVVILGQDPYHGAGQAHGLCFSTPAQNPIPPSLKNIFREIHDDTGIDNSHSTGDLTPWAKRGVLLLNTVLTVRAGTPNSHRHKGWEQFTDDVLRALDACPNPLVFLLWGKPAGEKARLLTSPHHLTLTAAHPSPLSAYHGFFGCRHFSKTNDYLIAHNIPPIDWHATPQTL